MFRCQVLPLSCTSASAPSDPGAPPRSHNPLTYGLESRACLGEELRDAGGVRGIRFGEAV